MPLGERAVRAFDEAIARLGGDPGREELRLALAQASASIEVPMRVAVVGRIKAGKSTLLNALLGEEIAATGVEELTFNVNWFVHGERPSLVIHFKDGREPRPEPLGALHRLANRSEDNAELLRSIRHVEVRYPQEILTRLQLIDTPGFGSFFDQDSRNTLEFLGMSADDIDASTRNHAAGADAVLFLFARNLAASEQELVSDFQGAAIGDFTPVNAIAVLTKVDAYWSPDEPDHDPLTTGERVAGRIADEPGVDRLFHAVLPVCGLLAAGAATLTPADVAGLESLAKAPPDVLARRLRYAERFATRDYPDLPVPAAEREPLLRKLGQYGIWVAAEAVRAGTSDPDALRAALLDRSGLPRLNGLVLSHFGNRATVIKSAGAVNRSRAACRQALRDLSGIDADAVAAASGRLEEFEVREHDVVELGLLRALYRDPNRLGLTPDEAAELLTVTGEDGPSCGRRLGLDPCACPDEMLEAATARLRYWRRREGGFGLSSRTAHAVRTVVRSYERIAYHVREAKRHLEFDA